MRDHITGYHHLRYTLSGDLKMRIVTFILILSSGLAFSQECDCESNFNWLKKTFTQNDAGYKLSMDKKGKEYFEFFSSRIHTKVKQTNSFEACEELLKEWLSFFREGHLFLVPMKAVKYKAAKSISFDLDTFKQRVQKEPKFIDGIWKSGGYELAIQEDETQDIIQGIVISSNHPNWKKGDIKFQTNFDFTEGIYFSSNKQKIKIDYLDVISKGIIQLENFYFKKVFPKYFFSDQEVTFLNDTHAESPIFRSLDSSSNYLRIPSFAYKYKGTIEKIINDNLDSISIKENLIIDIRGNQGGSDDSFNQLIPIVYSNPIVSMGTLHYSTALNNKSLERRLNFDNMNEEDKEWYTKKLAEASKNLGRYIDINGVKYGTTTLDTIYSKPSKVYIIIDNFCASSAEEFLLKAKQSSKVKLIGIPTAGALDVSNLNETISPTNDFKLIYSTTKSLRLPILNIDDYGIQPDYFMHNYIPKYKWIEYILDMSKE